MVSFHNTYVSFDNICVCVCVGVCGVCMHGLDCVNRDPHIVKRDLRIAKRDLYFVKRDLFFKDKGTYNVRKDHVLRTETQFLREKLMY